MRAIALLVLLTLPACVGYARGDGQGNVEVVTNWGRVGTPPATAATDPSE